jgi:hypothetical protein
MSQPSLQSYQYQRRKPEQTNLYKIVQQNWLSFQKQVEPDLEYPPSEFVIKEFEEYLRCGILAHGFLRAQCTSCHSDTGEPVDFYPATAPSVKEIEVVLSKIITKVTKYLEKQKIIIRDEDGFQLPMPSRQCTTFNLTLAMLLNFHLYIFPE